MVDTPERDECATEGCHRAATEYFERGGVGSRYCADCATLVRQLSHPMTPKEVEDVVRRLEEHQGIGAALSGSGRFVCSLMTEAASLLRTQAERITELERERDEAQANAYRSNLECKARAAELNEANERAAKNWRDFRDLRLEITDGGPMCRDCADFDGRCQGDGRPCDPDEAVKEQLATWRTAQATLERYREALEPFAQFDTGPDLDDGIFFLHDDHPLLGEGLGDDWKPAITVSHFRRARSVLEGKE